MEQARVELCRVLPQTLEAGWEHICELLGPAVERTNGEYSMAVLGQSLMEQRMQLWIAVSEGHIMAALVTEVVDYNGIFVCELRFLGGEDMSKWMELLTQIEDWALTMGCSRTRAYARAGLAKTLVKQEGYEETHRVVTKDLRGRMQ